MIPISKHDSEDMTMSGQNKQIRQLKAELAEAREQAEAARLANQRKSEQIAAISHDIRTSLGAIVTTTDLLLGTMLDAQQKKYAEATRESSQDLLFILNQILDLSKLEAGRLDLEQIGFDPVAEARSAIEAMRTRIEDKGLQLQIELPEHDYLWLQGDPTRLRQILLNLIDNAIKFTAEGGITVRVTIEDDGTEHELRYEVSDTGIGLDPQQQRLLFAPYNQADNSVTRQFGGTGLGLSLVRKLSRKMSGDAGVTSVKGKGSTFWFTARCPRVGADGPEAGTARVRQAETPRAEARPAHILVAEDNHINRMLITTYLDKFGHGFDTVENGEAAVKAARLGDYDLILMDIHMPGMDGVEAARKIRAEERGGRHIPIIALTANAMKGDRDTYLAAGMDEYVSKPIDAADLFAKIHALVGVAAPG